MTRLPLFIDSNKDSKKFKRCSGTVSRHDSEARILGSAQMLGIARIREGSHLLDHPIAFVNFL
jgi:hypothetical protein